MNFHPSNGLKITLTLLTSLLLIAGYYGLKMMTSVFKTDMGNGVIIYADDYVSTGSWVYDCKYMRLISRKSLAVPIPELKITTKFKIGSMSYLNDSDQLPARAAIKAIAGTADWYRNLRYLYSGLDESSYLRAHYFDLVTQHDGRTWAIQVGQWIGYDGKSSFRISAEPYDPETYVDYAKALKEALNSCPAPQQEQPRITGWSMEICPHSGRWSTFMDRGLEYVQLKQGQELPAWYNDQGQIHCVQWTLLERDDGGPVHIETV